jgi:hypothetical protein
MVRHELGPFDQGLGLRRPGGGREEAARERPRSRWYDIRSDTRMGELLRELEGGGSNEYLRTLGRQTARRLLEGGLSSQLEYLHRTEVSRAPEGPARVAAFGRDLRLLTSMSASILNFSRWTSKPDPRPRGALPDRDHRGARLPRGARLALGRIRQRDGGPARWPGPVGLGARLSGPHRVPHDPRGLTL